MTCREYEALLGAHLKLLREMYQPFGSYTYIPKAFEFFISEADKKKPPTLQVTPPQAIVLRESFIRDSDLQRMRSALQGYQYMLYCYLNVDLIIF